MDVLQQGRRLVPASRIPAMVEKRVDKAWASESFRASAEAHMEYVLGCTPRAADVPDVAHGFAVKTALRAWLRWHPSTVIHQRVEGIEILTQRDQSRPTVLSFMHHNHYDGMFHSLKEAGADLTVLALAGMTERGAPAYLRQHARIIARGARMIPAGTGTQAVIDALQPGVTLAIASDVPGHTQVEFLGRQVRGSIGAARVAMATDSPVVLVTAVRDSPDSHHLQLHPPLDPRDYTDPESLLSDILRIHGEAVLAWPEAFDMPRSRFGSLDNDWRPRLS